ncbi:MAG: DUF4199 domain-containing protein [Bacteroidota bacterium]
MNESTTTPARLGFNYGLLFGVIMIIIFILQQFIPGMTPSNLSIVNLIVLGAGLIIVPVILKKQNSGNLTFSQGVGSNSMVILISTVVSALFIYLYVKFVDDFYLEALKESRLEALKGKVSEEQAEQIIARSGGFFSAEFIMIPLLISKFVIGFVFTFIVVAILSKRQPSYADR